MKLFDLFKSLDKKVEKDKVKFIAELKSADMKTLIYEMASKELISENVEKLQKRDKSDCSEDYRSWFAYRIADELSDLQLKSELMQLLSDSDLKPHRKYVLRCLSNLCVNTEDYELFDFLLKELEADGNEDLITTVLSAFEGLRKPTFINIDYLKYLITDGTYQNRIDALHALQNAEHEELEDLLLDLFKGSDNHTKSIICATLRTTGTEKYLAVLDLDYK